MKFRLCLIGLISLLNWLQEGVAQSCSSPFQAVPYNTGYYCAKCDTTCLTCSGSAINQCSTCPTDFTLNTATGNCAEPITTSVNTIEQSYHSYGFQVEPTWFGGTSDSSCGMLTVLYALSGNVIYTTHSLDIHYKVRVRIAFWNFDSTPKTMVLQYRDGTGGVISGVSDISSNATISPNFAGSSYNDSYCSTAYGTNFQAYITASTQSVRVRFTSNAATWGIREYIFIQYLCYQSDCASCSGPSASQCKSCAATNKKVYSSPGPCLCDFAQGYYAYPSGNSTPNTNGSYFCVNPCPNLPSGQYYGDNFTKTCVATCPTNSSNTNFWGLSFASDQYGFCVNQCPDTISLGGSPFPLYYDLINRRCTTTCPSAAPYSLSVDRACYTTCPSTNGTQYYMLNTDMTCWAICPNIYNAANTIQIPLFRDTSTFSCVQVCPTGTYGYHNLTNGDRYCVASCPNSGDNINTTYSTPLFQDNSTGRPLCTKICPGPNYFGDLNTSPPSCVTTCTFPTFGDQNNTNRLCVSKCNGSFYGLNSGNRQCMENCPSGTWGNKTSFVCVSYPYQCQIFNYTLSSYVYLGSYDISGLKTLNLLLPINCFADNNTRTCIYANQACSIGQYKLNTTMTCQLTCPSGTFANNVTMWCVQYCYGLYFADSTLNQCVLLCSPGLYADVGSNNFCVSRCNQSGAYPYKDDNIRQCVSICTLGYADPTAQACVFNCTPGLYLNGTDSTNTTHKVCASNCSSPYFAYNNTDSGICLETCPSQPPLFGDTVSGLRVCVEICSVGYFGDQTNTTGNDYGTYTNSSFRKCVPRCANGTFAQNDSNRLCVVVCSSGTYGRTTDWTCVSPQNCPAQYVGDNSTNLCVNVCPNSNLSFTFYSSYADNNSKLCVSKCPIQNTTYYYADIHSGWCIDVCNSVFNQFGNNSTQTCEPSCLDNSSFADSVSPSRYCIALCTNSVVGNITTLYYRNNFTSTCVISTGCNITDFADNSSAYCVEKCPIVPNATGTQTWGYIPTQTCVALCLPTTFGDNSTGIPLCVSLCPTLPTPKWSYKGPNSNMTVMLCMIVCPSPFYGQDLTRTCVTNCPRANDTNYTASPNSQTYAYDGTRRCLTMCPNTFYADYISGVCFASAINCTTVCPYTWTNCTTYRWGDPYNNSCTYLCTGSPWDTYGDNLTQTCTSNCSVSSYADNYTGTRICVAMCPGYYTIQGVVKTTWTDINGDPLDSYGDNYTQRCEPHCVMPSTYADWQTHLCTLRCSGDNSSMVPTYANIITNRCVIALFCPVYPDLYFGQNVTRQCLPACPSGSNISYADNLTRSCIPVCYKYYNASFTYNTSQQFTMFYGDDSTNRPQCIIACPTLPRLFGRNDTHLCVSLCTSGQYGDQTGNRTCVSVCPNIDGVTWFSQDNERICVLVCENGTWGNYYNTTTIGPHCQVIPWGCMKDQYADNSTRMCVPQCPQSMNYFGDPSSRLCTTYCPNLNTSVLNSTYNVNSSAGRLFADYSTRLCVYTCPLSYGPQGTFGDNSTNTCVSRCPNSTFGDANTTNRFCVAVCTLGSFGESFTTLCVQVCPASPPSFGDPTTWRCVTTCPLNYWADSSTRTCSTTCNPNFRLNNTANTTTNECVSVCPSEPDLYGDTSSYNCTAVCSNSKYADPTDRLCKSGCYPLFQFNYRCVQYCPNGTYALNSTGDCVVQTSCDTNYYGDNSTTKCVQKCPSGSYSDPTSRYCIAICPAGTYGDSNKCVTNCTTISTSASNITQLCQAICTNYTYSYQGICVSNCTGATYQNDQTHLCDTGGCPANLYADPNSHRCVAYCPTGWYRKGVGGGTCVAEANGCFPQFADFVTGNCVDLCSTGYWGFKTCSNTTNSVTGNYTCIKNCPTYLGLYGYASATERNCYFPKGLPTTTAMFADTISGQFVLTCPVTPTMYFGDTNRQWCVSICQSFNLTVGTPTLFYGDPQTSQCQFKCQNTAYTADNATRLCTLKCTYGTFRYNNTANNAPVCTIPCPEGFGDYSTRVCVATCPITDATFGFYNMSSGSRLCVQFCPQNYYAEPVGRTCIAQCPNSPSMYYAYNSTRQCLTKCIESFAFDDTRVCVSVCSGSNYPNADNSTDRCVLTCPTNPDYYSDSNVCVFFCTTSGYFADPNGRVCRNQCSNTTDFKQYADPRTGRCVQNCSEGYWGDNTTNKCVPTCPPGSFADNTTQLCVAQCPINENTYADMFLHVCAQTCSNNYFGSQINQTCIAVCDNNTWGDPTTTLCTPLCPVKIYSYGQNDTRICVNSCQNYSGYADNYSRLCRAYCQHTITPQTYIDYNTHACVSKCPLKTWAANHTALNNTINQCVTFCPSGFADNSTQRCVAVCPSEPQTYGDSHYRICIYSCLFGQFSDNTTNLCVPQCPSLNSTPPADYYGDGLNGRCVYWCTEGTFAQNGSRLCVNPCNTSQFADNLTRRCVSNCPPSQSTFADSSTHRCVRICPKGSWAQNTTQSCVSNCWTYANGTVGYADNVTNFCVKKCPYFYFGTNSTNKCVITCPSTLFEFGHYIGRVCVGTNNITGVVDCYGDNITGIRYYGDPSTRTCVQKCPLTLWADIHLQACTTTCNSLLPEFRDNHTQMCVWPCSSDPDEYGDSTTGNCVRVCPPNYFAYTVNRTCVPSCGALGLYADNTTNRCVTATGCATLPYLYADNLTWTCVSNCTGPQFADNRTQACVPVCPSIWDSFGDLLTFKCVNLCPIGYYADKFAGRTCQLTCSINYFADNFTSSCVQHCRYVRPYWYEDISMIHGVCVAVCPGESYAYNPNQTCMYQNATTLASACPDPYFADRKSRQCVKFCPNGTFSFQTTKYCELTCAGIYYADPILRQCATVCSPNLFQYVNGSTNVCVQYCPSPNFAQNLTNTTASACVPVCNTLGLPTTRTCQNYCPSPYFANQTKNLCVMNCTPYFSYMPNRTCLIQCEPPYYGNPSNFTCDLLCGSGYFGRNDTRMCDTGCPNNSYADPTIRICVSNCPNYPPLFADYRYKTCSDVCASPLFASEVGMVCVSNCTNVTVGNKTLIYLADASNRMCVLSCTNAVISFADYPKNICTQLCQNGTFASNYTKQCVKVCPIVPNNTFSDNNSRICMDVCLPGSYGMSLTLNCVQDCWWPYYADSTTRQCVEFCPKGYFAENSTAICRSTNCPSNSFADPITRRCLTMCPALHLLFNYRGNWTCLTGCPAGYYANTDTNSCQQICNSSNGMYAYTITNQCVRECPVPYRGFAPNRSCVLTCPPTIYFYDITQNNCNLCDSSCLICTSVSTCLQCLPGLNLFNGYCNISCVPQVNNITYADPTGKCVNFCPPTYYGNNLTYACVQGCPIGQYGNDATRLCTYCPGTCASCTSFTRCLSCLPTATLAIDNMCYSDCNSTFAYSFNGTCWNSCPNGTYVTYTLVTCSVCAAVCLTCSGAAITCTSCSSTYFFNSSCLTVCPTGYYGSPTLQCLTCFNSSSSACTNPLNFTTSFSVSNYKPVITLQFNQLVSFQKQLSQILNINLMANRLLEEDDFQGLNQRHLQVGSLINNGITYTYQILNNGTILLYPQVNANLINPTFSISITDPASVISTSTGISLQNVQSLLKISALEYYPQNQGQDAETNFPAKFVTIFVLILYVLTFIFSDVIVRPIQIIQLFFFHCIINVNIPANLYYFLLQMNNSTFGFVLNWFSPYLPSRSPYYTTPQKIIDVFTDQIFLRNVGQIFTFIVIFSSFWFVFLILGNKRIVSHKVWHSFFSQVSQKRFQLMVINDILSVFYLPILFFSIMKMNILFTYGGFYAFDGFMAIFLMVIAFILPFIWSFVWLKNSPQQLRKKLWFLTLRVKKGETQLVSVQDHESEQGIKQHQFIQNEKHSIEKNKNQLQIPQFQLYMQLMAIWLAGLSSLPSIQLILLVVTNCLHLLYTIIFRPYINKINLAMSILSTAFLIMFEALFIYFNNNVGLFATYKTNVAFSFLVAGGVFSIIFILWALWRVSWEVGYYWRNFKQTLLYLQFADHDYVGEEEQSEKFSIYEKKAQNVEAGQGDLIIDEIIEKVGSSGEKIITVKKKRLRKKPKVQGRKKDIEVNQPQNQYVRVNQLNIFDYDQKFEQSEEQIIVIPRRGMIDDDHPDFVSDSQYISKYNEEEEEKKIDVDHDEEKLDYIQQISNIDHKSEQASEYNLISHQIKPQKTQQAEEEEEEKMAEEIPQVQNLPYEIEQPVMNKQIQPPKDSQLIIKEQNIQANQGEQLSHKDWEHQSGYQKYSELQNQNNQSQQSREKMQHENMSVSMEPNENLLNVLNHQQYPPIKNIQDLLAEEQNGRKKNLLFLFDDFDQQNS